MGRSLQSSSTEATLPVDGAGEFPEMNPVEPVDGEEEGAEMLVVKQPPPPPYQHFNSNTTQLLSLLQLCLPLVHGLLHLSLPLVHGDHPESEQLAID